MDRKSRLTIVTVCYNSADVLPWQAGRTPDSSILVVDNGSTDDTSAVAERLGHRVVRSARNLGFGAGAMLGLQSVETELALILNPDAGMDIEAQVEMIAAADRYADCDLFVPRVVDEGGQQAFRHDTTLEPRCRQRDLPWGDCCIPMISGAAILTRPDAFVAAGGFDPAIFLYFEDDDLALRFRSARLPMIHVQSATAVHLGNASTADAQTVSAVKERNFGWSRAYVGQKHGAPMGPLETAGEYGKLLRYILTGRRDRVIRQHHRLRGIADFHAGRPAPGSMRGD